MARKSRPSRPSGRSRKASKSGPDVEKGIFGNKIFSVEEEHSLLLFVAGIVFGIGLVSLSIKEYYYMGISLFVLLLVLVFIDKRIQSMRG